MSRRYWKTTATTTVLTEGDTAPEYRDGESGLEQVAYDITYGDASGVTTYVHEEVSEAEMHTLLLEQGSDPSFLLGEDDGDEDED